MTIGWKANRTRQCENMMFWVANHMLTNPELTNLMLTNHMFSRLLEV